MQMSSENKCKKLKVTAVLLEGRLIQNPTFFVPPLTAPKAFSLMLRKWETNQHTGLTALSEDLFLSPYHTLLF